MKIKINTIQENNKIIYYLSYTRSTLILEIKDNPIDDLFLIKQLIRAHFSIKAKNYSYNKKSELLERLLSDISDELYDEF